MANYIYQTIPNEVHWTKYDWLNMRQAENGKYIQL